MVNRIIIRFNFKINNLFNNTIISNKINNKINNFNNFSNNRILITVDLVILFKDKYQILKKYKISKLIRINKKNL